MNTTPEVNDRPKFKHWVESTLSSFGLQLRGLVTLGQKTVKQIETANEELSSLKALVTRLSQELEETKNSLSDIQLNFSKRIAAAEAQLLAISEENQGVMSHYELVEYVDELVNDFGKAEENKGANILAYNSTVKYDTGTVGHALTRILESLKYQPTFFNLGPAVDVKAEDTVTVNQTNTVLFNPKNVLPGKVSTIHGGQQHDTLMLTFRGDVTLVPGGNLRIESELSAAQSSVVVLRKVDQSWIVVWSNGVH